MTETLHTRFYCGTAPYYFDDVYHSHYSSVDLDDLVFLNDSQVYLLKSKEKSRRMKKPSQQSEKNDFLFMHQVQSNNATNSYIVRNGVYHAPINNKTNRDRSIKNGVYHAPAYNE